MEASNLHRVPINWLIDYLIYQSEKYLKCQQKKLKVWFLYTFWLVPDRIMHVSWKYIIEINIFSELDLKQNIFKFKFNLFLGIHFWWNVKFNYCSKPYKRLKGYILWRIVLMTWEYFIQLAKLYYSENLVLAEEYLVNLILSFIIYVFNVFSSENE